MVSYQNAKALNVFYGSDRINKIYAGSKLVYDDAHGYMWGWLQNSSNSLGLTGINYTYPEKIGNRKWLAASMGGGFSLAIDSDRHLWSCGINNEGQLGLGDTDNRNQFTQINSNKWDRVICGGAHSLAIDMTGCLWAWGCNSSGELGLGDKDNRLVPEKINDNRWLKIAAGLYHSLAIDENGYLWAWGNNTEGQLGVSSPANSLPYRVGTRKYVEIAAGFCHSLAIDENGYLWAWGRNTYGECGLGYTSDAASTNPPRTPQRIGNKTWSKVAGGQMHSLAIDSDGYLWAWGGNNSTSAGALGLGDTINRTSPAKVGDEKWMEIACGRHNSIGINLIGHLFLWGDQKYYTPEQIQVAKWAKIFSGPNSTGALLIA